MLIVAALAALTWASEHGPWSRCRCLPTDPCWQEVDWPALNKSVQGRLSRSVDPIEVCRENLTSLGCSEALEGSDDEFWLTAQPNGFLHTGQFGLWNLTTALSRYTVEAVTEADIAATVAFARRYNLRLAVKSTGHDWYGRSTAGGGLLLWTHRRKRITWHSSFVPVGGSIGVPAVTVESGVQFSDLYPQAQATPFPGDPYNRATIVMGGGCDSVGVAGCWLGGCYNVFTKKFGDAAVNLLEAKVVLANGTIVVASETSHPDLFWSLRGGGGGNTGVVTEFTARTHPAPRYMLDSRFTGRATDLSGYKTLFSKVLELLSATNRWPLDQQCTSAGPIWSTVNRSAGLYCRHYEGDQTQIATLYAPFDAWCELPSTQAAGITCGSTTGFLWNQTEYREKDKIWDNASFIPKQWIGNEPWISFHPDREISTALLGSLSKYIPLQGCNTVAGRSALVDGIVRMDAVLDAMSGTNGLKFIRGATGDKSQSGMPPEIVARFQRTALNPVLLDAAAFILIMVNIPSLPQLPPSARLLKALWPRLQQYAVVSQSDPLWAVCEKGATGSDASAVECMEGWNRRIPAFRAQIAQVRQILWDTFPNHLNGTSFSGSYLNEADYEDPEWQQSFWGSNYPRLLELKKTLDPQGLFYGHHAVGSELWSPDGNCRLDL